MGAWILTRLWPSILALVGWAANQYSGIVTDWVANHQDIAGAVVTILLIVVNLLKSPKQA